MNISDEGLRLLKSFEGYHTRLPNGSCAAYQTYLGKNRLGAKKYDIPTIGYGCTHGVTMGMVWTEAEAEAALRRELATFENAVNRLVTVSINTNERDALILLSYNIGVGNFQKSTVLRRLNKGDRRGAAQAFSLFNKAQGIVLDGLVSRRMREAALFLKPAEKPVEPIMPQSVEETKETSKPTVATVAATVSAVATVSAPAVAPTLPLPAVPEAVTQSVTNIEAWKATGGQLWTFGAWLTAHPMQGAALVLCVAAIWFGPSLLQRKA